MGHEILGRAPRCSSKPRLKRQKAQSRKAELVYACRARRDPPWLLSSTPSRVREGRLILATPLGGQARHPAL
jgi:hypothetical protein